MLWWHSAHMSYIQVVGHRKVLDNFMSRKVIDFSVIWYSAYDFLSVSFYRAMLCIRGTSHGPVSVCPSVSQFCPSVSDTSQSSTNTAKQSITQTTPHDRPRDSSFLIPKISAKFDRGHPLRGRRMQVGWSKSATFDKSPAISRKR